MITVGAPRRLCSLEGIGPVHEVEVQVVQFQVLQSLQEGWLHILCLMAGVPQLRRDEHILPPQGLMNNKQGDRDGSCFREEQRPSRFLTGLNKPVSQFTPRH